MAFLKCILETSKTLSSFLLLLLFDVLVREIASCASPPEDNLEEVRLGTDRGHVQDVRLKGDDLWWRVVFEWWRKKIRDSDPYLKSLQMQSLYDRVVLRQVGWDLVKLHANLCVYVDRKELYIINKTLTVVQVIENLHHVVEQLLGQPFLQ